MPSFRNGCGIPPNPSYLVMDLVLSRGHLQKGKKGAHITPSPRGVRHGKVCNAEDCLCHVVDHLQVKDHSPASTSENASSACHGNWYIEKYQVSSRFRTLFRHSSSIAMPVLLRLQRLRQENGAMQTYLTQSAAFLQQALIHCLS